jgi:hypothetical protein
VKQAPPRTWSYILGLCEMVPAARDALNLHTCQRPNAGRSQPTFKRYGRIDHGSRSDGISAIGKLFEGFFGCFFCKQPLGLKITMAGFFDRLSVGFCSFLESGQRGLSGLA